MSVISSTQFWGVEVPPGRKGVKVKVEASDFAMEYVHVNQAALGDRPAPGKTVLYASVDGEAFAVGTLEKGRTDMFQMEMIFDTDFRLSHTGSGPVYITGYKTQALDQDLLLEDYDDDDNDDDDDDYDDDDDDDSDGDGYTIPQHIEYGRANGAALPSANDDDSDDDSDDDDDDVDDGFVDFEEDDDFDEYEDFDDDDIIGNDDDDDDDDDESSDDDDDDDDIDTQPPPKRSKANTPTPKYASPKKSPRAGSSSKKTPKSRKR